MEDYNIYLKKEEKEKIIDVIKMAKERNLNKAELIEIFPFIMKYCKNVHFSDSFLTLPSVAVNETNENVIGNYNDFNNTLTFSNAVIDKLLNDKDKLLLNVLDLFSTIGHEMMHYSQNDTAIKISNLSSKSLINEKINNYVSSYKNDLYLTKQEIKTIHELATPFIENMPANYTNLMDYYSDVSFALYSVLYEEKEARDFECNFLISIEELVKGTEVEEICISHINELISFKKNCEDEIFSKCNSIIKDFKKMHDLSVENIIEIAKNENVYLNKIGCSHELYERSLKLLIDNKENSQKIELLKVSAFNAYSNLFNIVVESLINNISLSKTQNIICSLLTGEMYNTPLKPNEDIYKLDFKFNNLLKQNQFETICEKLLKDNSFSLFNTFITYNSKYLKKVSINTLLNYIDLINKKGSNVYKNNCLNSLFNYIEYDKKIELAKSHKMDNKSLDILKNVLINDCKYMCLNENDIKKLFAYNKLR